MKNGNAKNAQVLISKINTLHVILPLFLFLLVFQSCSKESLEDCIQRSLDEGMTPLEVYTNCEVESGYTMWGYHYGGGIIIDFDETNGTGLIASISDLDDSPFGCYGTFIPAIDSENTFYGDGEDNTIRILASDCSYNSAAKICDEYSNDGFEDWFLPSGNTLQMLDSRNVNAQGEYWSSSYIAGHSSYQDSLNTWSVFVNQEENCEEHVPDGWLGGLGAGKVCFFKTPRNAIKKVRAVRKF